MRSSLSPERQQEMIFCIAIIVIPFVFPALVPVTIPLPILIGFHSLLLYLLFGYQSDRRLAFLKGFLLTIVLIEVLFFIYEVGELACTIYPCK